MLMLLMNMVIHHCMKLCHKWIIVELLVKGGAKVNAQNIDGKTPLHIAVERQQFKIVERLLNMDSDVGLTNVWHNTPIHYMTSELLEVSGIANIIIRKIFADRSQHWLIPNMVGVSASAHINTWRMMCKHVKQTHNRTFLTIISYGAPDVSYETNCRFSRLPEKHTITLSSRCI